MNLNYLALREEKKWIVKDAYIVSKLHNHGSG